YTSGTTGKPKGTVLTHKGIVKAANMKTSSIPILSGDRSLCVLPMFHTGGLFDLVMPCIYKQCTVVLRKNFSATEFWESIERYKVNAFLVVPTILNILLRTPEADEVDTSSLRFGLSGAAPIPPEQLDECEKRFGIPVLEAYGATENTGGIAVNRIDQRKTGSVGLGFDGIQVSIFDKKGEPLPTGEIGEIVVKGDTVMHGYYNSPELTAETIKDGWLHTGDLGYVDDDGFFFIVDRKKDMIIRGGVNVYPKELENIIAIHPKVSGVAVIPESHDKYGQVAKACIVVLRGQTLTEDEIRSFCLGKMAEYKVPEIFLIRESLPTNALGKVVKKDLIKELAEEENAEPVPCAHFFEAMPGRFIPEKADGIEGTVSYNITGKGGGKWTIHIKDKKMTLTKEVLVTPTVYVVARDADYHDIATGKIDGVTAVMTGKWKIEGDVNFMAQLRELLRPIQD
ncbi:MAG: AMP-binding protein, partial [Desulfobacterales bacterium]|nr:AMP-binding protein [Desulfobacterales bacterium]